MVVVGLLEDSLKVLRRWSRVALDAASVGCDVLHVKVVHLLSIVVIITTGCGSDTLRTPLPPLSSALDVLHGTFDDDARWRHLAVTGDGFPTS
jgi:hypothetical protein